MIDLYPFIRPFFFQLEPETAHNLGLKLLKWLTRLGYHQKRFELPSEAMGLRFPNPLGLAAGCDKDGDYTEALAALGFGFLEVGTVTPRPQPGNPRPRLFRLVEEEAVINRMGFNSRGLEHLVENLKCIRARRFILGVNLGKNRDTPPERAVEDYLEGMRRISPYADYVTLNLSSPNTPGLRSLQFGQQLTQLLEAITRERARLEKEHRKRLPLVLKIAPDIEPENLDAIAEAALDFRIDGIIATNTTVSRAGVEQNPLASEKGGLSGRPLFERAKSVVALLAERLKGRVTLIGCGGILSGRDAVAMLEAGADLLQIYSGLVFRGPHLVTEILETLEKHYRSDKRRSSPSNHLPTAATSR